LFTLLVQPNDNPFIQSTEPFFNIHLTKNRIWVVNIRIAYCLTVHTRPEQVGRLLDRIGDADDHYYVDVFNKGLEDKWLQVLDRPAYDIEKVFKYSNGWGSFKLVQATLDAMEHFRDKPYDYFINLSGQCYPLRPIEQIKQRLAAENGKSFVEYEPFPRPRWSDEKGGYRRLERIYFRPFRHANMWSVPRIRKIPLGMRPYGGSQWFCLHKAHVEFVLSFLEEHPEVVSFYKRSLIPDEMFFQTILMNSEVRDEIVNDNKRFTDWSKKCTPLPATLLSEDVPRLERSGKFFARKFDTMMDAKVLDILDSRLLSRRDADDGDFQPGGGDGGRRVIIRTVS